MHIAWELSRGRQIVLEAKTWIGTPYAYGQAVKGVGCDCTGLLVGVLKDLHMGDFSHLMQAQPRIPAPGYARERLCEALREIDPIERMIVGDVMLFKIGELEQHIAIYSGDLLGEPYMIHQLQTLERVAEQKLTDGWIKRCTGVFRLKDGE